MRRRADEDLPGLFAQMCRIRAVEEAARELWERGLVSGELHLGLGEEAVAAGVLAHLREGDALSLDYRSTPPLVARGVPIEALVLELLGHTDGLCGGRGGHMHLMSADHLAASSGVVGAPAPLACGFALAARTARTGAVAVAFFGDGAVNQGMVMESLNLAAVWRLPVVFVCKDNRWAVTTRSARMTGGGLRRRLSAFGMPAWRVDGRDVDAVSRAAGAAVARARRRQGPTVLLARVQRLEGHFVGDPLVRITAAARDLIREVWPLVRAAVAPGGGPAVERTAALLSVGGRVAAVSRDSAAGRRDPLAAARRRLPAATAHRLEREARAEVAAAVSRALARAGVDGHA